LFAISTVVIRQTPRWALSSPVPMVESVISRPDASPDLAGDGGVLPASFAMGLRSVRSGRREGADAPAGASSSYRPPLPGCGVVGKQDRGDPRGEIHLTGRVQPLDQMNQGVGRKACPGVIRIIVVSTSEPNPTEWVCTSRIHALVVVCERGY
jgi:hypothetical protein